MALASREETDGEAMARKWHEDATNRLIAERTKPMKKFITIEQWFNGQITVDRGVVVELPEPRATQLVAGGYVKPVEDEADAPQNRRVTTSGTAGPKGK